MTDIARALVRSLVQRWDADPHRLAGLISQAERDAIWSLVENGEIAPTTPNEAPAPPRVKAIEINRTAMERKEVDHQEITLCFDFGTARSKAFAVAGNGDPDNVDLVDIPLGDLDADVDGSVYAISSSVWINETGLVFVGSEAIRRSQSTAHLGTSRVRIDSLKHLVSLAAAEEFVTQHQLSQAANPTTVSLTLDHVLTLFLAYLTDLATSYLQTEHQGRYVRRRFSLPCWPPEHRTWSTPYLAARLAAAQIVADTFTGQWAGGIPAAVVKEGVVQAIASASAAQYLMDQSPELPTKRSKRWAGILEPLAAGSTRVWRAKNSKEVVLVLDVGAGTTDLALFWVVQLYRDTSNIGNRAFPLTSQGKAIRVAGNHLDNILVDELIKRARLDRVDGERKLAEASLRLAGVRRLKEELFNNEVVRHKMGNDLTVEVSLEEFLALSDVEKFRDELEENVRTFLRTVDRSWDGVQAIYLVLTGGGCDLPMVTRLAGMSVRVGEGGTVPLKATPRVPSFLSAYGEELSREYPQLAVAMGGALPLVLEEGAPMKEYPGDAPAIGRLERFPTRGV